MEFFKEKMEKDTFVLCFLTIIWKRIWVSTLLYCEYNSVPLSYNVALKCLKYNLLSPTGIVQKIKPYLEKALTNGFLMPKEFSSDKYVKKAILLFSDAYKICQIEDEEKRKLAEKKFIHDYASSAMRENEEEKRDTLKDIGEDVNKKQFCDLVNNWDIVIGLVPSTDPYIDLLEYSLFSTLKE